MTITAVLLAHFPERKDNIKRIVSDLKAGTLKPDKIIVFIDDPAFDFSDPDVIVIRSDHSFPVTARLAIGLLAETDYVYYMDDDLTVEKGTMAYLAQLAVEHPGSVLGGEGTTLANTLHPYTQGQALFRGNSEPIETDILIGSWFTPRDVISAAAHMLAVYQKDIGNKYLDDILLSLANRFILRRKNYCVPNPKGKGLIEIGNKGAGQSLTQQHYETRDKVCRFLIANEGAEA